MERLNFNRSSQCFAEASKYIPGGVNSPARSFQGVDLEPLFIQSAQGPYVTDEDGYRYIDYVGSFGPAIVGHTNTEVTTALSQQINQGLSFGAPTQNETRLAELIHKAIPSMAMMRFVNSGTEATMSAIRLARAYTGKNKIIKFKGCYHGHADHLLVEAGSGALTSGRPSSLGVPESFTEHTLIASFNDLDSVKYLFESFQDQIAGVIIEPIAGNMNMIKPEQTFLDGLQQLCQTHNALLIADEVMTGFRVAYRGAQYLYGLKPDITILGKIIGGGMPIGAFGGRRDIMAMLAPYGPVYQAGTLAGNPLAMAAGIATLKQLEKPGFYQTLASKTKNLTNQLNRLADHYNMAFHAIYEGGMFGIFFHETYPVTTFDQAANSNQKHFQIFFHHMLAKGVYFAPSPFEAGFMSIAHQQKDIDHTLSCFESLFQKLQKQ